MSIEPTELVCPTSSDCIPNNGLVRIQHRELHKELFRLPNRIRKRENRMPANRPRDRGDELHHRLVRRPHRVLNNATPEDVGCHLLLVRKSVVEPVDQDIRINAGGHGRRDPLASSHLSPQTPESDLTSRGVVRWPDRTTARALQRQAAPHWHARGLPGSCPRLAPSPSHLLGECRIGQRLLSVP